MLTDDPSVFWFVLDSRRYEAEKAFALLRIHTESVENQLEKESSDFQEWLQQKADMLTSAQREELYEHYGEDLEIMTSDLPSIHRSAMFLSAYALFEHHLNEFCKSFHGVGGITLDLNEVAGQGIERAKIYLSKVIGISFPVKEQQWMEIRWFNKIRNILVHRNGELNENSDKAVIEYVRTSALMQMTHAQEVTLKKDAMTAIVSIFDSFFKELYRALTENFKQRTTNNRVKPTGSTGS